MPKIIVNAKQKLIEEARRQATECGYETLNIRTVAKNCGISVGTVYNYFPSKDSLVAAFLTTDWDESLRKFRESVDVGATLRSVVESIYRELHSFQTRYAGVFQTLAQRQSGLPNSYHNALRDQLCDLIKHYCSDAFTDRFIVESLITWSVQGAPIRKLTSIIEKIVA